MDFFHHQAHYLDDLVLGQRMEHQNLVDAIEQLRTECLLERIVHRTAQPLRLVSPFAAVCAEAEGCPLHSLCAQVTGHYNDRIAEIHGPAMAVGQPAVLQYLEQDVEDLRVGLFYFVEEHYPVRAATHRLGKLARFVVADIPGRRPDQARNGVLLGILGHVDTDHVAFVVEQEFGQCSCKFGLPHAGRAQQDETADGPSRVADTGPGAANSFGDGIHRLILADDPLVQFIFHVDQPLRFTSQKPSGWNTGPFGHQLGNVGLFHHHVHVAVGQHLMLFRFELRLQTQTLGAQLGRVLVL